MDPAGGGAARADGMLCMVGLLALAHERAARPTESRPDHQGGRYPLCRISRSWNADLLHVGPRIGRHGDPCAAFRLRGAA